MSVAPTFGAHREMQEMKMLLLGPLTPLFQVRKGDLDPGSLVWIVSTVVSLWPDMEEWQADGHKSVSSSQSFGLMGCKLYVTATN